MTTEFMSLPLPDSRREETPVPSPRALRRQRREARRRRARRFFLLLLAAFALLAAAAALFPAGARALVNRVTAVLTPIDNTEYRATFRNLLAKNPELEDYVRGFSGVTSAPEEVDLSAERENARDGIPLLMQWDSRWGYCRYGAGLIGYTGCGPTALSMVLVGLTGNEALHPGAVAAFSVENGYCVVGNGTSWELFTRGAEALGLKATELPLDEGTMERELDAGRPLILILGPGDFTDSGHFIVVTGYDEEGFRVNDPFRHETSEKHWTYERLKSQIRNLWSYEAV